MSLTSDFVPVLPPGVTVRIKHSLYLGAAVFAGGLISKWSSPHTVTGLWRDARTNWDEVGGDTIWSVLAANGLIIAATARRRGIGGTDSTTGTNGHSDNAYPARETVNGE